MAWLLFTAVATSLIAALIATRLLWAWYRLKLHPHVETVEIACPALATELNALVKEIANKAGVEAPALYIRRASLPNAFVIATILRPELYLTDELLEYCDTRPNSLELLMQTICHEITHLKRGDALPIAFLTWGLHAAGRASIRQLEMTIKERIACIEASVDEEAHRLLNSIHPPATGAACDL